MKLVLALAFFLFFSSNLLSHPGIGIVQDSKGNIYYTDLVHVWKISPDGTKSIAVRDVHTHKLYIDEQDNLYGENSWYNGEAVDTWGYTVWRLAPSGELDYVIPSSEGFLSAQEFSFTRDADARSYWIDEVEDGLYAFRQKQGEEWQQIAEGRFEDTRWDYWLNGEWHFIDLDDLYRIRDGKIELIAADLQSNALPFSAFIRKMHSIMGIWGDPNGNTFVAVFSGKVVKKISPDGKVSDFLKVKGNWSPSGGLFDASGNLWLLEYSSDNDARVRKFTPEQLANQTQKSDLPLFFAIIGGGLLVLLLILGLKYRQGFFGKRKSMQVVAARQS